MKLAFGVALGIVVLIVMASNPVNGGDGFPNNGPCSFLGNPAICNDNGNLGWYDGSGNLTYFSKMVGQKGDKGDPGTAATVQVGTVISGSAPAVTNSGTSNAAVLNFVLQQGPQGVPGPPPPANFTLTCQPSSGSIPKGFTTKCTWQ